MRLRGSTSMRSRTDYWDLKEDLEDLNDDIEFYKEKWEAV